MHRINLGGQIAVRSVIVGDIGSPSRRNYTVIGTEGRIENFGDSSGGVVKLWNRRHEGFAEAANSGTSPSTTI